ncbi:MAG TPA: hypothetical protein VGE74_03330 [Gemmata sp.]
MPIPVVCSNCSAELNAPDTAAGKRLKCPKCQAVCPVPGPAFEVVDDPAPPAAPPEVAGARAPKGRAPADERERARREPRDGNPPRTRRPVRDAVEEERPRGTSAAEPARGKAGRVGLLVGCLFVGVLLTGGGAFGAYWFALRGKLKLLAPPAETVALDNWEEYTAPGDVFKARFPGQPEPREWKPVSGLKVTSDIREHRTGEPRLGAPSVSFFAGYVRFPDNVEPAEIDDAKKWLTTRFAAPVEFDGIGKTSSKITVGGRDWQEERMVVRNGAGSTGVVRWHVAGPMLYLVGHRTQNQEPPAAAVTQFFDAYEVLGNVPGDPDPDPVALDNWHTFTSPGNFKASFPGEAKTMSVSAFTGAKETEFREYTFKDARGWTRTYFAGFARFAAKPNWQQHEAMAAFARQQAVDNLTNGRRRVEFGGWPWGEEYQRDTRKHRDLSGTNGIARVVEAGDTLYAAGSSSPRFPREKEIEQFFGSFEILGTKPGPTDLLMPPNWAEYRSPDGAFRAAMPRTFYQPESGVPANQYAGIPIKSRTGLQAKDVGVDLSVGTVRFLPNTAAADRRKVLDTLALIWAGAAGSSAAPTDKPASWAGRDAIERTYPPFGNVARLTLDADIGYVAVMKAEAPNVINPAAARAFFDSFSFDKDAPPLLPPKAEKPVEWSTHKPMGAGFTALMPVAKGVSVSRRRLTAAQQKTLESVQTHRVTEGTTAYTVLVVRFVPGASVSARQAAMNALTAPVALTPQAAKLDTRNAITWGGRDALEHAYTPADLCACRQTHNEKIGYVAAVYVASGKLNAENAKRFLNSFTFDD